MLRRESISLVAIAPALKIAKDTSENGMLVTKAAVTVPVPSSASFFNKGKTKSACCALCKFETIVDLLVCVCEACLCLFAFGVPACS